MFATKGMITSVTELSKIMRSLSLAPTMNELSSYFQNKGAVLYSTCVFVKYINNTYFLLHVLYFLMAVFPTLEVSFPAFLDIMHKHKEAENAAAEISKGFKAMDKRGKGEIPAKDLMHILMNTGEKMSKKEGSCLPQHFTVR